MYSFIIIIIIIIIIIYFDHSVEEYHFFFFSFFIECLHNFCLMSFPDCLFLWQIISPHSKRKREGLWNSCKSLPGSHPTTMSPHSQYFTRATPWAGLTRRVKHYNCKEGGSSFFIFLFSWRKGQCDFIEDNYFFIYIEMVNISKTN